MKIDNSRNETDTFSTEELYLLASAFGASSIFGLDPKEMLITKGLHVMEIAREKLITKGILTNSGALTDGGALVIQTLKHYYMSSKYVRLNQFLFGFSENNQSELITLVEIVPHEQYQLLVLAKSVALRLLTEQFPILLREPSEQELREFTRSATEQEQEYLKQHSLLEPGMINIEFFHLTEEPIVLSNPKFYQQWLVFEFQQKVAAVNFVKEQYFFVSQYWLLKLLFDELEFPYVKEDVAYG